MTHTAVRTHTSGTAPSGKRKLGLVWLCAGLAAIAVFMLLGPNQVRMFSLFAIGSTVLIGGTYTLMSLSSTPDSERAHQFFVPATVIAVAVIAWIIVSAVTAGSTAQSGNRPATHAPGAGAPAPPHSGPATQVPAAPAQPSWPDWASMSDDVRLAFLNTIVPVGSTSVPDPTPTASDTDWTKEFNYWANAAVDPTSHVYTGPNKGDQRLAAMVVKDINGPLYPKTYRGPTAFIDNNDSEDGWTGSGSDRTYTGLMYLPDGTHAVHTLHVILYQPPGVDRTFMQATLLN